MINRLGIIFHSYLNKGCPDLGDSTMLYFYVLHSISWVYDVKQ